MNRENDMLSYDKEVCYMKDKLDDLRVWLILFLTGIQTVLEWLNPLAWAFVINKIITKLINL